MTTKKPRVKSGRYTHASLPLRMAVLLVPLPTLLPLPPVCPVLVVLSTLALLSIILIVLLTMFQTGFQTPISLCTSKLRMHRRTQRTMSGLMIALRLLRSRALF